MPEYSQPLGDVVRQARKKMELTQDEVAAAVDIDSRTVINIENYRGNPKMEVLYPLVRCLKIDPRDIFYPELQRASPMLSQLRLFIEDCSEEEASVIMPVLQSVLSALRSNDAIDIN